ncbi:MAG: NAD-dependent epimerase/dehydratase family protein [Bacteroidota bacterium]|nr:NAD-dependent epimerase/dehydratase family protein [Bacteroidota bacterium]
MDKVILVTGGTGLVGSHLLFDLCKSGEQVRALKRCNSNIAVVKKVFSYYAVNADELLKNIEWVDADLLDLYSLMEAMDGIAEVYHCAAMVSFEQKNEAEMMKINVEGTANMVNAALEKGIKKFCHVSSIATLGRAEHGELSTEETFWKTSPDHSNYANSKYAAEREVWRASEEGLDVVIVNPALIIGAGNWQQSSSNMFSKGYTGMKYYTEGVNGFIDVRDVTALMILLMKSNIKNERFLFSSENTPYRYFFDLMHQEFGRPKANFKVGMLLSNFAWRVEGIRCMLSGTKPLITRETIQSGHRISLFSNEKIKKIFPDYKFISIEQAVKDTCKLYLSDNVASSIKAKI